jgi:hypothetical protein
VIYKENLPSLLALTLRSERGMYCPSPDTTGTVPAAGPRPEPATLSGVRSWVYPWPASVPGLGLLGIDPFELCSSCSAWTWARYGATALCFACATKRAKG